MVQMLTNNGNFTMDFQTEALRMLTDIKNTLGSVDSTVKQHSTQITANSNRIAWLERVCYGGIAIGAALLFLFPHAGIAIAHLLSEKPPHESRQIHPPDNSE
jgi:hypothetical protein